MQDDTPSQFGNQQNQTSTPNQADKEWSELQRDLDMLGRQLAELSTHTAQLGEHFLASLQARFQDVKNRAAMYRTATEHDFEQMQQTATSQAERTFSDIRARSTEAAKQVCSVPSRCARERGTWAKGWLAPGWRSAPLWARLRPGSTPSSRRRTGLRPRRAKIAATRSSFPIHECVMVGLSPAICV